MTSAPRCTWVEGGDDLMLAYHDEEWGVPSHDDRHLFEMLCLEGAQAGLSWTTILRKREGYRSAFAGWDPRAVAAFTDADVERLLGDPGIVRNRLKVQSAIANGQAVLEAQERHGSFDAYLWAITGGPVTNRFASIEELPAETETSKALSKQLKRDGFRFVGPTTCYAFMQAVGMVNDHEVGCFRYGEVAG